MKAVSAHRSTSLKIFEDGKEIKAISHVSLNYYQDFQNLKRMIEGCLKKHEDLPLYDCDTVFLMGKDGQVEINNEFMDSFKKRTGNESGKLALHVHVKPATFKEPPTPVRSTSRGAVRVANRFGNSNKEDSENSVPSNAIEEKVSATPVKRSSTLAPTPGKPLLVRANSFASTKNAPTATPAKTTVPAATPVKAAVRSAECPSATTAGPATHTPAATPRKQSASASVPSTDSAPVESTPKAAPRTPGRRGSTFEEKQKIIQAIEDTWTDVPSPLPPSGAEAAKAAEGAAQLDPFDIEPSDEEFSDLEQDQEDEEQQEGDPLNDSTAEESAVITSNVPFANNKTPVRSPVKARRPAKHTAGADMSPEPAIPKTWKAATPNFKKKAPSSSSSAHHYSEPKEAVVTGDARLFKTGLTLAEEIAAQERSLRQYAEVKATPSKKKKPAKDALSPVFNLKAGKSGFDGMGRPSIGTMTTQWEFMRSNFLNNSEEDLEWLMVSKKAGAYKYAHRKNEAAEDKYFKSLHDIEKYETRLGLLTGGGAKLPLLIAEIAEKCKGVGSTGDPKLMERLTVAHEALQKYCEQTPAAVSAFPAKVEAAIQLFLEETDKLKVYRKARDLQDKVPVEIKAMQAALVQARRDSDESLVNMEKWAKRERETDDYAAEMRAEEEEWLAKEQEPNAEALRTMRRFVPVNIADITVSELMSMARDEGGLLSLELANEIKNNRLLHWMVTHTDDIASSNFLSGDRKAYFENLEAYDVIELRALAAVMPVKFDLDNDGKKMEWRGRMMTRVKQLVAQSNRDKVKGCWDDNLHRRSMIELPPLKPEQQRRLAYFYRTKEQSDVKLKQYDDKAALLAKKEGFLAKAETEATDAKAEYDVVLKEMRDPDFVEEYGAEKLTAVKEMAKREWAEADRKMKTLTQDVNRLRKAIADAPLTREQFWEMERELERHLKFKDDFNWSEKGQAPVLIEGVFDPEPYVAKVERQAAKCVSAEQEAAQRKAELSSIGAAAAATAPKEEEPSRAATPVEAVSSLGVGRLSVFSAEPPKEVDAALFASPKVKRNSVLNANPQLAAALNKMLTSALPGAGGAAPASAVKPFRRASTLSPPTVEGEGDAAAVETVREKAKVEKVKKISKSKLLMKLIAPKEQSPVRRPAFPFGGPAAGGGGMSFLDELKAKKLGSGGAAAPPAMSFLDELKAKKAAAGSGDAAPPAAPAAAKAPMSFLDQIKGFRKKDNNETSQAAAAAAAEPVSTDAEAAPAAPRKNLMPNMGLMEMIRARRID